MTTSNQEIEVRFPDIDTSVLLAKLKEVGARDCGEELFQEIVFDDEAGEWNKTKDRVVRLRKTSSGIRMAYKRNVEESATGTTEIEFGVDDMEQAEDFLKSIGLQVRRRLEKLRHVFVLNACEITIDTYPSCAPFAEIEGLSEEALKEVAKVLGLDWKDAYFKNTIWLLIEKRNMPLDRISVLTFDKIEYTD